MEHRFEADEWQRLTVEQRLRRCHLMAEEAQKLAEAAPAEMAGTYLQIATDWLQLATEMQNAGSGAVNRKDEPAQVDEGRSPNDWSVRENQQR